MRRALPHPPPPQVHQETFGRSGCRRIVPGQYLACDPKGRAVMIAAVEKQKFVYVLNRDAAANLTISSPLEAHKSHNVAFSVCALDCGFDNPVFATIELDYSDADQVSVRLRVTEGHFVALCSVVAVVSDSRLPETSASAARAPG